MSAPEPDSEGLCTAADRGDDERAFQIALALANAGDTDAMLRLAIMYSTGAGTKYDIFKAIEWEREAAEKGDVFGFFNLGVSCRTRGEMRLSRQAFERAAALGLDEACLELAKLYSVSDRERDRVISLLRRVIQSGTATEGSREEAERMLSEVSGSLDHG